MKNSVIIIAVVAILCVGGAAAAVVAMNSNHDPTPGKDVEIWPDELNMTPGQTMKLNANQDVSWKSSNTSVATVDSKGNVTAVAAGECEIIAYTSWDSEDADVTVSGSPGPTPTKDVEITPDELFMTPGQTSKITANQEVSWRSTNTAVATVDANGNVTAVAAGTCEIIAYTSWDSEDADVTVSGSPGPTPGQDIEVWPDDLYLVKGETAKLTANQEVSWRSTNTAVATVDANGNVTAVSIGFCKIVASTSWDTEDVDVEVTDGKTISDIDIEQGDQRLSIGETVQLNAKVYPSTASQEVKWTSSNPSVAKVDSNGLVTAIGKGECEIRATASDGFHDDDIDVNVY